METKTKIILVALIVVALIFGGISLYNNYKMQLNELIPEENWYHVEISAATPTESTAYAVDDEAAWEIMQTIIVPQVDRGGVFAPEEGNSLTVRLSTQDAAYIFAITVMEDGRLSLSSKTADGEKVRYYEGAAELYRQLKLIADLLPAENT